jgi:hypothetical protein
VNQSHQYRTVRRDYLQVQCTRPCLCEDNVHSYL